MCFFQLDTQGNGLEIVQVKTQASESFALSTLRAIVLKKG